MRRLDPRSPSPPSLLPGGARLAPRKTRFTIRGAGFGHGVGMSQYGALRATRCTARRYDAILRHYYTGTALGTTDPAPDGAGAAAVEPARRASAAPRAPARARWIPAGPTGVAPPRLRAGRPAARRQARSATFTAPLQVAGAEGGVQARRRGGYRGLLEFRPGLFGGVNAINARLARGLRRRRRRRASRRPRGRSRRSRRRPSPPARTRSRPPRPARLRPVRRHALAGLRRRGRRDAGDQRGGGRDARPGRHVRRRAGRHLLLLHLRRADRGRREHESAAAAAVAEVGRGPVRRRVAEAPLGRRSS